MDNKNDIKCKPHVIAFLDILGSSEIIKENSLNMLNEINELYSFAIKVCRKDGAIRDFSKLRIKIFSDNILVAREIEEPHKGIRNHTCFGEIYDIVRFVGVFQGLALGKKFLLRGGITIGELYFDDIFVWGNGLLRAYELESSIAIFPRIAVDDAVICELKDTKFIGGNILDTCKIAQDFDLVWYIDYLKRWNIEEVNGIILNSYNDIVEKIYSTPVNRVIQKLTWHINYVIKYLSEDIKKEILVLNKNEET